jgi:hypothetical protein
MKRIRLVAAVVAATVVLLAFSGGPAFAIGQGREHANEKGLAGMATATEAWSWGASNGRGNAEPPEPPGVCTTFECLLVSS